MIRDWPGPCECLAALRWGAALAVAWLPATAALPAAGRPSLRPVIVESVKLTAVGGAPGDRFGDAVAVSGDLITVGAKQHDDPGLDSGAAYVFERLAGPDWAWHQAAELIPFDAAAGELCGIAVAASGDTVALGCPFDGQAGFAAGAVHLFERDRGGPGAWGEAAKLLPLDAGSGAEFGFAVAISGDTLLVGAPFDAEAGFAAGAAYVFERDEALGEWRQAAKLLASDAAISDQFGLAVAVSGDLAAVGAELEDGRGAEAGAAYLFGRDQNGFGSWGEIRKLTASDGGANDRFGHDVAVSGDRVVVTAHWDDDLGFNAGAAYVYERDQGGPGAWGEAAKLTASDGQLGDWFGSGIGIDGDLAIAGAELADGGGESSGAAYLFERRPAGEGWVEALPILAPDAAPQDAFGGAVAISGRLAVVGAREDDDGGTGAGAVYALRLQVLTLTVAGECPGPVELRIEDAAPGQPLAILRSREEGVWVVPSGPCAGIELGLERPRLLAVVQADGDGRFARTIPAPPEACGWYLQAVDGSTCAVSDTVSLP